MRTNTEIHGKTLDEQRGGRETVKGEGVSGELGKEGEGEREEREGKERGREREGREGEGEGEGESEGERGIGKGKGGKRGGGKRWEGGQREEYCRMFWLVSTVHLSQARITCERLLMRN